MAMTSSPGGVGPEAASPKRLEFLLEEYGRLTESLLHNEESGEKRAAFFMTLTSAAGAAFAFAFNDHKIMDTPTALLVAGDGAGILLFLGVMTIRRLAERHKVTDEFVFALRQIRRTFLTRADFQSMPNMFGKPYKKRPRRHRRIVGFDKGGWLESVAAVNALLAGVAVAAPLASIPLPTMVCLFMGVVSVLGVWTLQIWWSSFYVADETRRLYVNETVVFARHRAVESAAQRVVETEGTNVGVSPGVAGSAVLVGDRVECSEGGARTLRT